MPGAPKNSKDVFTLCRGFERAFSYTVDVSAVASMMAVNRLHSSTLPPQVCLWFVAALLAECLQNVC